MYGINSIFKDLREIYIWREFQGKSKEKKKRKRRR